jgi:dTDP-4-amino-4,6-dideoxygalactose transaminase
MAGPLLRLIYESMNPHQPTIDFEKNISEYTRSPYVVCLDNGSSALFLSLMYDNVRGKKITIPPHTYMSVPCSIIHAGGLVVWDQWLRNDNILTGAYPLKGSNVIDSALRFTADMYISGTFMCCSFTGAFKRLNLGKGGCILTDNEEAYEWFKLARYSGREECSYHDQKSFNVIGWNMYMPPMEAALGNLNFAKFYKNGEKVHFPDISLPYPDLRNFKIYTK